MKKISLCLHQIIRCVNYSLSKWHMAHRVYHFKNCLKRNIPLTLGLAPPLPSQPGVHLPDHLKPLGARCLDGWIFPNLAHRPTSKWESSLCQNSGNVSPSPSLLRDSFSENKKKQKQKPLQATIRNIFTILRMFWTIQPYSMWRFKICIKTPTKTQLLFRICKDMFAVHLGCV